MTDDFLQGSGQIVFLQRFDAPHLAGEGNLSAQDQLPHDLADKERISLSELGQLLLKIFGQTQLRKDPLKMLSDVGSQQRGEGYPIDVQFRIVCGQEALKWVWLSLSSCLLYWHGSPTDKKRNVLS